eukprot:TRINITY_DN3296_c0_g1_i1.p1 TRINITY_DN3296_c0_g1~~TRINITY_DN3296_c0_g1_i1.p1  ORF type:complete len:1665 (-),score=322.84 TRINITY_DN3296_c0_g1_i1:163-5157(-)
MCVSSDELEVAHSSQELVQLLEHGAQGVRCNFTRISQESARRIAQKLSSNCKLRRLDICYSELDSEALLALASGLGAESLQHLSLGGNKLSTTGGGSVALLVRQHKNLTHLDLELNGLGDEGCQAIAAQTLQDARCSLKLLDLSMNCIQEGGAKALAEALKGNQTLQQLDLRHNRLGAAGGQAIAAGLAVNRFLLSINLEGNDMGPDFGVAMAAALTAGSMLQRAQLGFNKLGAQGAQSLASGLLGNCHLQSVALGANEIGDTGAMALAAVLMQNRFLNELLLGGNDIGSAGGNALLDAVQSKWVPCRVDLCDNQLSAEFLSNLSKAMQETVDFHASMPNVSLSSLADIARPGTMKVKPWLEWLSQEHLAACSDAAQLIAAGHASAVLAYNSRGTPVYEASRLFDLAAAYGSCQLRLSEDIHHASDQIFVLNLSPFAVHLSATGRDHDDRTLPSRLREMAAVQIPQASSLKLLLEAPSEAAAWLPQHFPVLPIILEVGERQYQLTCASGEANGELRVLCSLPSSDRQESQSSAPTFVTLVWSPPHRLRGIRFFDLTAYWTHHREIHARPMNMYDAMQNVIKPSTAVSRKSVAEHYSIGPVQIFVSHSWGHQVDDMFQALTICCHSEPDARLWLYAFAQSPWADDWGLEALTHAVESCQTLALLLGREGSSLKRFWCLYEALVAGLQAKARPLAVRLCSPDGVLSSTQGGAISITYLLKIQSLISRLDASEAECSSERDKYFLLEELEKHRRLGINVNREIKSFLNEGLRSIRERGQQILGEFSAASPLRFSNTSLRNSPSNFSNKAPSPSQLPRTFGWEMGAMELHHSCTSVEIPVDDAGFDGQAYASFKVSSAEQLELVDAFSPERLSTPGAEDDRSLPLAPSESEVPRGLAMLVSEQDITGVDSSGPRDELPAGSSAQQDTTGTAEANSQEACNGVPATSPDQQNAAEDDSSELRADLPAGWFGQQYRTGADISWRGDDLRAACFGQQYTAGAGSSELRDALPADTVEADSTKPRDESPAGSSGQHYTTGTKGATSHEACNEFLATSPDRQNAAEDDSSELGAELPAGWSGQQDTTGVDISCHGDDLRAACSGQQHAAGAGGSELRDAPPADTIDADNTNPRDESSAGSSGQQGSTGITGTDSHEGCNRFLATFPDRQNSAEDDSSELGVELLAGWPGQQDTTGAGTSGPGDNFPAACAGQQHAFEAGSSELRDELSTDTLGAANEPSAKRSGQQDTTGTTGANSHEACNGFPATSPDRQNSAEDDSSELRVELPAGWSGQQDRIGADTSGPGDNFSAAFLGQQHAAGAGSSDLRDELPAEVIGADTSEPRDESPAGSSGQQGTTGTTGAHSHEACNEFPATSPDQQSAAEDDSSELMAEHPAGWSGQLETTGAGSRELSVDPSQCCDEFHWLQHGTEAEHTQNSTIGSEPPPCGAGHDMEQQLPWMQTDLQSSCAIMAVSQEAHAALSHALPNASQHAGSPTVVNSCSDGHATPEILPGPPAVDSAIATGRLETTGAGSRELSVVNSWSDGQAPPEISPAPPAADSVVATALASESLVCSDLEVRPWSMDFAEDCLDHDPDVSHSSIGQQVAVPADDEAITPEVTVGMPGSSSRLQLQQFLRGLGIDDQEAELMATVLQPHLHGSPDGSVELQELLELLSK